MTNEPEEMAIDEALEELIEEAKAAQKGMRKRGAQPRDVHGTVMELIIKLTELVYDGLGDANARLEAIEGAVTADVVQQVVPGLAEFCQQARALALAIGAAGGEVEDVDLQLIIDGAEKILEGMGVPNGPASNEEDTGATTAVVAETEAPREAPKLEVVADAPAAPTPEGGPSANE